MKFSHEILMFELAMTEGVATAAVTIAVHSLLDRGLLVRGYEEGLLGSGGVC